MEDEIMMRSISKSKLVAVLAKHQEYGSNKYQSGELRLAGHNYAKDILAAVEFVANIVANSNFDSLEDLLQKLETCKAEFESEYEDYEGFGCGTISGIINDLES